LHRTPVEQKFWGNARYPKKIVSKTKRARDASERDRRGCCFREIPRKRGLPQRKEGPVKGRKTDACAQDPASIGPLEEGDHANLTKTRWKEGRGLPLRTKGSKERLSPPAKRSPGGEKKR